MRRLPERDGQPVAVQNDTPGPGVEGTCATCSPTFWGIPDARGASVRHGSGPVTLQCPRSVGDHGDGCGSGILLCVNVNRSILHARLRRRSADSLSVASATTDE
jgi:hypothetical protein